MPETEISLHPRCANALTAMQFLCIPKIYIILRISDPQLPNEPLTFCEAKILFPFPVLVPLLWSKISLGRTWLRTWQVTFGPSDSLLVIYLSIIFDVYIDTEVRTCVCHPHIRAG